MELGHRDNLSLPISEEVLTKPSFLDLVKRINMHGRKYSVFKAFHNVISNLPEVFTIQESIFKKCCIGRESECYSYK
jgi:hypothetical protein